MPDESPHQPHDKLFKSSFHEPETAAAFLSTQLPAELACALDWSNLRVEPGSFIDEHLRGSESDLLYRVPLREESAFLYLLFEHQRSEDPWLALRLLRYIVRIWEKFRKEHPEEGRLPPVIPVVLAQNARPWKVSPNFHDLLAVPEGQKEAILSHTPGFSFRLVQLASLPFEKIVGTPLGVLTLRVLKAEQAGELLADIVWDEPKMLLLPGEILRALLRYIYHAGGVDKEPFLRKLETLQSAALQEDTMTLAEQFRQEGHQRGRQEGWKEGRQEGRVEGEKRVLKRLLQRKFGGLPLWAEERLEAGNFEDLERWSERILDAVIIEDVFV